ncbi:nitrous oxide reductase accessory protein NosL [Paenisporosarcina sp. TG-14]|uniref:nitrous oxide reductase accessory protein NosL n=1 Tax=Paenisporosarcina sp. TG-14 TaxID=1231057 RepID=UPI00031D12B3|nr:nitrous oxide reductase accessory protein NosL [Paenisporosarcina sp. TG-14]
MKKILLLSVILLLMIITAACVAQDDNKTTDQMEDKESESSKNPVVLSESNEDTTCEYCKMDVYKKTHDMGMFSAQGITEEGKSLFFDDVGCMLNQERIVNSTLEKYVRDYHTLEWIKLDVAVVVKAEIKTPMNYGYAFFEDKEGGQAFIEELGSEKASFSSVSDIDEVSGHRHIKKIEKMKNAESKDQHDMKNEENNEMNELKPENKDKEENSDSH